VSVINWQEVLEQARSAKFNVIPAGEYHIRVEEPKPTNASTGSPMIKLRARVQSGPHARTSLLTQQTLTLDNPVALRMFVRFLNAFGIGEEWLATLGTTADLTPIAQALDGREAIAVVKIGKWADEDRNEIDRFKPMTAGFAPAGPAAPVAALPGMPGAGFPGSVPPPPPPPVAAPPSVPLPGVPTPGAVPPPPPSPMPVAVPAAAPAQVPAPPPVPAAASVVPAVPPPAPQAAPPAPPPAPASVPVPAPAPTPVAAPAPAAPPVDFAALPPEMQQQILAQVAAQQAAVAATQAAPPQPEAAPAAPAAPPAVVAPPLPY
jgi:hypothetical protein